MNERPLPSSRCSAPINDFPFLQVPPSSNSLKGEDSVVVDDDVLVRISKLKAQVYKYIITISDLNAGDGRDLTCTLLQRVAMGGPPLRRQSNLLK